MQATAAFSESVKVNVDAFDESINEVKSFLADYNNKEGVLSVPILRDMFWIRLRSQSRGNVTEELSLLYALFDSYNTELTTYIRKCNHRAGFVKMIETRVLKVDLDMVTTYTYLLETSNDPKDFERNLVELKDELNEVEIYLNSLNSFLER